MLARLLPEEKTTGVHYFSDVTENAWYAPSVERLGALGVILGRGDNTFDPGASTTRAEFTVMAARFFEVIGGQLEKNMRFSGFRDVPEDHWADRYIGSADNSLFAEIRVFAGAFVPDRRKGRQMPGIVRQQEKETKKGAGSTSETLPVICPISSLNDF